MNYYAVVGLNLAEEIALFGTYESRAEQLVGAKSIDASGAAILLQPYDCTKEVYEAFHKGFTTGFEFNHLEQTITYKRAG